MASRKWFFNASVLKKNITRFAPVWIIYGVLQILSKLPSIAIMSNELYSMPAMAELIYDGTRMVITNFAYGLICAAVLFGDMFRSRMCNAIYAMPVRREGWLLTNLVSGLLFSFVPNLVLTLLALPLSQGIWQVPFLWLAEVTLQYLFFFGAAVLAAYCTGKRFAMVMVYFLLNFVAPICYWMVEGIYGSMLYGLVFEGDLVTLLCPLVGMLDIEYLDITYEGGKTVLVFGDIWWYCAICALVGLAFMGVSVLLSRKRHMESAGEFLSIRWLRPVTLILFSLFSAMFLQLFAIPVFAGLAIGFFVAMMLLERTVRVLRKKTFLGAGILLGVYLFSLPLVSFDVFGVVRWVPQAQQVESVRVEDNWGDSILLKDPQEIGDIITVHKACIADRDTESVRSVSVRLYYTTKAGGERLREYWIPADSEAGRLLERYLSKPEAVLGEVYENREDVVAIVLENGSSEKTQSDPEDIQSLLDAIIADCEAGKMAQSGGYTNRSESFWLRVTYYDRDHRLQEKVITVCRDCRNIVSWAEAHDIDLLWY